MKLFAPIKENYEKAQAYYMAGVMIFLYLLRIYLGTLLNALLSIGNKQYSLGFRIARPVVFISGFAFYNPIVFHSVSGILIHGVYYYSALLVIGYFVSLSFAQIGYSLADFVKYNMVRSGYLDKCRNCEFRKMSVKDYLPDFNGDFTLGIHKWVSQMMSKIDPKIFIYVVKRAPELASNSCEKLMVPKQLASYANPFGDSFIFLRDEPSDLSVSGRFFLRHEIGHSSIFAKSIEYQFYAQIFIPLSFITWSLINTVISMRSILLIVATILTYFSLRYRSENALEKSRLADEVAADGFGLATLGETDRQKLAVICETHNIVYDPALTEIQNLERKLYFEKNIVGASSGEYYQPDLIMNHRPLETYTFIIMVFLLSLYSREPSRVVFILDVILLILSLTYRRVMAYSSSSNRSLVIDSINEKTRK